MGKQYKIETYYYGEIKKQYEIVSSPTQDKLKNYYELKNNKYVKTTDEDIVTEKKYYIEGNDLNIIIPSQQDNVKNIIDLAIQAYPGTTFKINGNSNPIIIGPSGIFQWKVLDNEGYINSIQFVDFPFEMTEDQLKQIDMLVTYGYYEE